MRRHGQVLGVGLFMAMWLAGAPRLALADERKVCPVCGRAGHDEVSYSVKAGATLSRGAANTLFGWTELIRQPADEVRAGGNVMTGVAKGVGESVKRTLGGVGEVLTFWTPKVHRHYLAFSNDCPVCMKNVSQQRQPAPSTKP